jgi:hypothetical protein
LSSIIPNVQILDANDVWQSAMTGLMSCQIDGGMTAGASKPSVGRCELLWNNSSQVYNPDPAGGTSSLLRARRRIRVTEISPDHGNIMQVIHTGAYGIGGVTAITASGKDLPIGNQSGLDYEQAQTILVTAGWLYQIIIHHGSSVGTPSGTMTWTLYQDDDGVPSSTVAATGTYTPTASADNTITPTGVQLDEVLYWLHLKPTTTQSSGVYWTWQASVTSTYADGHNVYTTDGGTTWTVQAAVDCQCSIETWLANAYVYQDVTRTIAAGETWTLTFEARTQYDSYCSKLYAYIATNAEASVSSSAVHTNRWSTYTFAFTTTLTATTIGVDILPYFTGNGHNSTALELRNITLIKTGEGVNVLTNGDFASGSVSPWSTSYVSSPTSSNVLSVIRDYRILFNGKIKRIEPAPFQQAGAKTCRVVAVDFVDELQRKKVTGLALQKDQRGDQLVATALTLLLEDNPKATIPGKLLDTGKQVFSRAFDGYTKNTSLYDVITDCAVSEYGLWWVDPDGTLRWVARDYVPKQLASSGGETQSFSSDTSSRTVAWWHIPGLGQTFTTTQAGLLVSFGFRFWVKGSAAEALTVNLREGGKDGTLIYATTWYPSGVLVYPGSPLCEIWVDVTPTSDIYLKTNTVYAVELLVSSNLNPQNYWSIKADDPGGFANGTEIESADQTTWSDNATCDLNFRFTTAPAGPALTLAGEANTASSGEPFQMLIAQDASTVINKAVLTWHPRATLPSVVLGQVSSAVSIPPLQTDGSAGETEITLTFRDPTTQEICGGENVITPLVATTDYLINDSSDGTGYNYTTNSHFSMEITSVDASQITITLSNTATGTLYATKLQVRGDAVVTYDSQTITYQDDTAIALDDESAWTKDLPFNDDENFVTALSQYLVNRYKTPFDTVEWVRVDWRATIGGVDVLSIEPLDVIAVSDVQTGITTAINHLVMHWNYQFTPQGADYLGSVTWGLERADDTAYGIYDDPVYGLYDSTMRYFI